ncbi:hypothetical protein [Paenibacillus sp. OSY-SE]|nr:hypothetical protein [Paenibacillus sp. OSY-SE]
MPVLTDAYVAYECKVTDIRTHGDHAKKAALTISSARLLPALIISNQK